MLPYKTIDNQEYMPEVSARLIEEPGFNPELAKAILLSLDGEIRLSEFTGIESVSGIKQTVDALARLSDEFDIQPPLLEEVKKSNPNTTLSGRVLGFMLGDSKPYEAMQQALVHEFLITGKFEDCTNVDMETLNNVVEQTGELDANSNIPFHMDNDVEERVVLLYSALENVGSVAIEQVIEVNDVDMDSIIQFIKTAHELPEDVYSHMDSLRYDTEALEVLRREIAKKKDFGVITRFNMIAESAGLPEISKKEITNAVPMREGRKARPRVTDTKF
jgi:hypothetical protein